MKYRQIIYEPGKVARVKLNRPQYRNCLSRILLEELDDAFRQAANDDEVRVIVLSGEGDNFSSGHDLGTPEEMADREERGFYAAGPEHTVGRYMRMRDLYVEKTLRWRALPKPTIAMVQGYCIFGAWIVVSSMDLIFASEDALFLPAHVQYFSAPWDVGPRKAKELLFEHRFMTAHEAYESHFVNHVYPRDKLEEETLAYANRVAENDPFRLRMAKFSVNHMMDAMGFTTEVEAAYHTYFLREEKERVERGYTESRAIAAVEVALKNLEASLGRSRDDA
jgi:enoyl-CoA hydratase